MLTFVLTLLFIVQKQLCNLWTKALQILHRVNTNRYLSLIRFITDVYMIPMLR